MSASSHSTATVPFPYAVTGVAGELGNVIPIEQWAELARLPNRKRPGQALSGADLQHILGVRAKSFDPQRFRSLDAIVDVARAALESARIRAVDLDALIVATGSAYQALLDQDAFEIARKLGLPDSIPPTQMGTGCAGVARAAAQTARSGYRNVLVVTYFIPSVAMFSPEGELLPEYRNVPDAPLITWACPATFSDAVAAVVLSRDEDAQGVALYSRDATSFGGEPPVTDALVHYLCAGAKGHHGAKGAHGHYAMSPNEIRRYYPRGMMLNHRALCEADPRYPRELKRLYVHQAGPMLVHDFIEAAGLPEGQVPSNAADVGNTVSASTLLLLQQDVKAGRLQYGDLVGFSVVGSGPERGAFTVPVRIPGLGASR
jgi:3-oxoacyl-[acyl-carrier-protein] synthase III